MDDALAQIIGAAVGGGGVAGAIILGLLRHIVRQQVRQWDDFKARTDAEMKLVRERWHSVSNAMVKIQLDLSRKNGAPYALLAQRVNALEEEQEKDHARIGKLEEVAIRLTERRRT